MLNISRLTLLLIAVVAIIIALDENSVIFTIVSFAWAGFGATFGPLMLFSLFWKRTTRAGAIAGMVKDGVPVNIQCVGAGAVNQAIKAVAIARGFLIPTGFDVSCAPVFSDILINGESRTAIRLSIYVHQINRAAMDNVVMDDVKPVA